MRFIAPLALSIFSAMTARSETLPEVQAFELFAQACLHDDAQFDSAVAIAESQNLAVAPAPIRNSLVPPGTGAAWVQRVAPHIILHASLEAGCGVMVKPAPDQGFADLLEQTQAAELVEEEKFESSWARWYVLDFKGARGVVMAVRMDVGDSKSAFMRYLPAGYVLNNGNARSYFDLDVARFERIQRRLAAP